MDSIDGTHEGLIMVVKIRRAVYNLEDFKDRSGMWVSSFVVTTESEYIQYHTRLNTIWRNINIRVSPNGKLQNREPTYVGCTNDFADFQSFAEWATSNPAYTKTDARGRFWEIDKDIAFIGNKSYNEESCSFVPSTLNKLLNIRENSRGNYPLGVYLESKVNSIKAQCRTGTSVKFLGYHKSELDAHRAWQEFKIFQLEKAISTYQEVEQKVLDGIYNRVLILKNDFTNGVETKKL